MNNSILGTIIVTWIAVASCEGQEVFHKDLNDKIKVSILQHEVPEWKPTNEISSANELVLMLNMPGIAEQSLWTNRWYHHEHADPLLNTHTVFDVVLIENQIHLCYQQGVRFSIEEISSPSLGPSAKNVSRFDLARVPIVPGWVILTNAAFGILTDGTKTLIAHGTGSSVLVWAYRNQEWVIDLEASKPAQVAERTKGEYAHWLFRSNQWILQ